MFTEVICVQAKEIINKIYSFSDWTNFEKTCDVLKAGSEEKEVKKVAVTMFPTIDVIKNAHQWGADMMIVHEPMYYNHMDVHSDEKIECEKRKIVEETGITIYRYHDYAHRKSHDIIAEGEYKNMGLNGKIDYMDEAFGISRVTLDESKTPREVAKIIEDNLNIAHIRICGAADAKCTKVSGIFGAAGSLVTNELKNPDSEIVLAGETCEWALGEYARDAAALGYKKALLIMGHAGSERDGMMLTADLVKETFPDLDVKYFECGEVYTYTDK